MNEENEQDRSKSEEELRLLYQVTVQDLAFFKQQQWTITNYVLLLLGALFGVMQIDHLNLNGYERLILCVVVSILAVVGVRILYQLERSVLARRERLRKIRRTFTKLFCLAWNTKYKEPDTSAIAWLLGSAMVIGAVFFWWFGFIKPCF